MAVTVQSSQDKMNINPHGKGAGSGWYILLSTVRTSRRDKGGAMRGGVRSKGVWMVRFQGCTCALRGFLRRKAGRTQVFGAVFDHFLLRRTSVLSNKGTE